jgi:putative membrane protein
MKLVLRLLLSGLAVFVTAKVLSGGVHLDSYFTALLVAVILGVINFTIKPIIKILTLPINLITLGLFSFIINALMVMLVDYFVKGFEVQNFIWALLFSLLVSIINSFLSKLVD